MFKIPCFNQLFWFTSYKSMAWLCCGSKQPPNLSEWYDKSSLLAHFKSGGSETYPPCVASEALTIWSMCHPGSIWKRKRKHEESHVGTLMPPKIDVLHFCTLPKASHMTTPKFKEVEKHNPPRCQKRRRAGKLGSSSGVHHTNLLCQAYGVRGLLLNQVKEAEAEKYTVFFL